MLFPVAPLRFTIWVGGKVAGQVDREQFSPQARIRQLQEIDDKRKRGDLDEKEAAEAEAKIIEAQAVIEPDVPGEADKGA